MFSVYIANYIPIIEICIAFPLLIRGVLWMFGVPARKKISEENIVKENLKPFFRIQGLIVFYGAMLIISMGYLTHYLYYNNVPNVYLIISLIAYFLILFSPMGLIQKKAVEKYTNYKSVYEWCKSRNL